MDHGAPVFNGVLLVLSRVLLWTAFLWALGNCVYVYLLLDGARSYRVETAAFIFAAVLLFGIVACGPRAVSQSQPSTTVRRAILMCAVLLVVSIYLPLLTFPFLSDDYVFIERYQSFRDISYQWQFFRPMFAITFWLVATLGGNDSIWFHIVSLMLHLTSAALIYALSFRFFRSEALGLAAFVLFALSPIQLEAVLWVSGLQELLWTASVLFALWIYTGAPVLSPVRIVTTGVLIAAALGSKETAVCFLPLFAAADWMLFRGRRGAWLWLAYILFCAELVVYLYLRQMWSPIEAGFIAAPTRYFVKQLAVIPYRVFVQPWNVAAVDVPPGMSFVATVVPMAVLLAAAVRNRLTPATLTGPVVIALSTLPVYSYFYVSPELEGARYLYFGSMGWAVFVADVLRRTIDTAKGFAAVVVVLAVVQGASLQMNLRPWRTSAEIVGDLAREGTRPIGAATVIQSWRDRLGPHLLVEEGIPREYKGVTIFRNGYEEFVRLVRKGQ